jgi:hypothetical protein
MSISGISGFEAVTDTPRPVKNKRVWTHPVPVAVVSQETRDRLYAEAIAHPNFAGLSLAQIQQDIDDWVTGFLADKPYWYGHTGGPGGADASHHAAQRKHRDRREKEQHDREMARAKVITHAEGASQETEHAEEKGGSGARQDAEQMPTAA